MVISKLEKEQNRSHYSSVDGEAGNFRDFISAVVSTFLLYIIRSGLRKSWRKSEWRRVEGRLRGHQAYYLSLLQALAVSNWWINALRVLGPGGCWWGFFLRLLTPPLNFWGGLLYFQRTGLLPLLFKEYYVLLTVIFLVFLAGGGMGRVEITHKYSPNKEPVKCRHLAPGFCWLQRRHHKPTNTNCFHVCSHF